MTAPVVVAVTGASGAPYAVRLIEVLLASNHTVELTISTAGQIVLRQECGILVDLNEFHIEQLLPDARAEFAERLVYHHYGDFMTGIASGSHLTTGMVLCPCSGSTLGAVANGTGNNLIHRAAEVHLKERRRLILVPRETPLSLVYLENLTKAARAGAVVLPASPGWYNQPQGLSDLVDFVVARILDQLQIEHQLGSRWGNSQLPQDS